ncbi:MAG: T9SS type A sorting domain-containing protein [Saprospiraceae bacterium]
MRIIYILIFVIGFLSNSETQPTCDILTPGISANPSTIMVGQTSDLVFSVYNDAQGDNCCYEVESVLVYVFLPTNGGLTYQSIVSPAGGTGPFFDWEFDIAENTIIGLNHTEICDAEGESDVTIRIIGSVLPFYPQNRTLGISILQNPDGPPFLSNDEGNDNGITTLTITAPLPIELISFKAYAKECKQIQLVWQTATEINNDFMEIQRSEDGRSFESLGKLKGTNTSNVTSYVFNDGNVSDGTTYYYRLRQVDFDGKEKLYDPLVLKTRDCGISKNISIFPNPVMEKLNIDFNGFEESIFSTMTITNFLGEIILEKDKVDNLITESIDVTHLTPGSYNLRIENKNDVFIHRFIKI